MRDKGLKPKVMSLERAKKLLIILATYGTIAPEEDVQAGAETLILYIQHLEKQIKEIRQND